MAQESAARRKRAESRALIEHAFRLARELELEKIVVEPSTPLDVELVAAARGEETVIWLLPASDSIAVAEGERDRVVHLPDVDLSRTSQVETGLFFAVLAGHLRFDESVVGLFGFALDRLDTVAIANPLRDFPWFRRLVSPDAPEVLGSPTFLRVVEIALRLAAEGREGRAIGTIFVVGDQEDLEPHLSQLILNPLKGHPKRARSVHDQAFVETLRELSALDGAIVVDERGVVESAGTYLDAQTRGLRLRGGLGARHVAAAALTAASRAVAVVVSQSSGTVTVFHDGRPVLSLEKPKPKSS